MELIIYFLLFLLLLLLYIQFERSKGFEISKDIIIIDNLPEEFIGLKIAHISDLHISKYGKREKKFKKILQKENPDIIFITGDFVSNSYGISPCLKTMKDITAPMGIWAVWGNNDNNLKDDRLKNGLNELGINILNNENRRLTLNKDYIWIIGVNDPYKKKDDLDKALEGTLPEETKILLAHSPEIMHKASKAGINFILAGHTHGGQICFPIIGPIYNHTGAKYASGKFQVQSTGMYVSRGFGMSLIPIRFLCPAEISFFTLNKKSQV